MVASLRFSPSAGVTSGLRALIELPPVDQHGAVHIAGAGHRQDDVGGADVAVHHAAVARVHGVDDVQRGLEDGVRLVERARVARQHARCQRLLDGEPFDVLHGDGVMGQPLLIGADPQREGGGRVPVGARQIAQAFELAQRRLAVGCVVRAVAVVTVKALDGHGRAVIACCAHQLGEAAGFGVVGQDFACKAKIRESCGEFRDGEGDRACHDGYLFGSRVDGAGGRAGTGWGCPGRVERAGRVGDAAGGSGGQGVWGKAAGLAARGASRCRSGRAGRGRLRGRTRIGRLSRRCSRAVA